MASSVSSHPFPTVSIRPGAVHWRCRLKQSFDDIVVRPPLRTSEAGRTEAVRLDGYSSVRCPCSSVSDRDSGAVTDKVTFAVWIEIRHPTGCRESDQVADGRWHFNDLGATNESGEARQSQLA